MSSIEVDEKKPAFMPVFLCEFSKTINKLSNIPVKQMLENINCIIGNTNIHPDNYSFQISNDDHKELYDVDIGNGYWAVDLAGPLYHYNFNVNLFDLHGQSRNFDDYVLVKYEDYKTIKDYCRKFATKSQDGKIRLCFNEYSYLLD